MQATDDGRNRRCRRDRARARDQRGKGLRRRMSALAVAIALYAVSRAPSAVLPSPATGDMSLLTMQRIKSYVDDTCTLDPHCQWTWDDKQPLGLRNVTVPEAEALLPPDYMYPPGDDALKDGQRGQLYIVLRYIISKGVRPHTKDLLWAAATFPFFRRTKKGRYSNNVVIGE